MLDLKTVTTEPHLRTNSGAPTILAVRGLTVVYKDGEPAIQDVSCSVKAGERVAIIGPNGAGKSTLMKTMMGLLQPQTGTVDVERGLLGYVPQHESVDWDFPVTVREVALMGRTRRIGWFRRAGRADWDAVDAALARVGMGDLGDRQIGELSGGQRRRVFVARALAQDAKLLVLDEPFSGVDAGAQADLMDVLDRLNRDGLTILLSTHDLGLAFSRFDKIMALRRSVIAYGTKDEVYTPAVLAKLYGGQIAAWSEGGQLMLFADDHHCDEC
jgi:ABC-type Mn2+/Zn2+ transport system ATPase subunit